MCKQDGISWRKPEASSRHTFAVRMGQDPPVSAARRGGAALVVWSGAGEGKGWCCGAAGRSDTAGGHILVCQRYGFGVRRGDHEADPWGADLVS